MQSWVFSVLAFEPLKGFDAKYLESAQLLASNPHRLITELDLELDEPAEPVNRAQQYLLLSLANNQQVLPQQALLNAIEGRRQISIESQPWLFYSLLLSQAMSLDHLGKQDKALPLANKVLQWAESNQHRRLLIQALYSRGLIYNSMLDSAEAIEDVQRAYSLAPDDDLFVAKGLIAGFIGLIYEYRAENELAIPYFEEAVAFHRKGHRWRDLGDAIYGLGRANKNLGNLEKGKAQLLESVEIALSVNDMQGVAYGQKELAGLFSSLDDKPMAEKYYLQAIETLKLSDNLSAISDVTISVASVNLAMGKAEVAHQFLDEAEKLTNPTTMQSHWLRLKYYRGKTFEYQGRYQLAYDAMMESYPPRLKLLKQQYSKKFEVLKNQFELDKLDTANQILEKENELKTNVLNSEKKKSQFLYLLVMMILIISLLLVFILIRARQSRLKFKRLSQTDDLTGLSNRRKAVHLLDTQIDISKKQKTDLSVAVLDLDYFKQINDNFGHAVGDLVLVEFASLCKSLLKGADIIGRIGGEEFLIGLPQTSVSDASIILDKLRTKTHDIANAFNQASLKDCETLKVSVSIGVTSFRDDDNSEAMIGRADRALYTAKNAGRDQVHID